MHKTKYGIGVSVEIIRDNATDTASVRVYAPLYINKEWTMLHCYKSSHFNNNKIMSDFDFNNTLSKHYN